MTGLPISIVQSPRDYGRDTELGQQQSSADISPPPPPPPPPPSPPSSPFFPFRFPGILVVIAVSFAIYSLSNTCTTMCVFHYPVTKVCRLFIQLLTGHRSDCGIILLVSIILHMITSTLFVYCIYNIRTRDQI